MRLARCMHLTHALLLLVAGLAHVVVGASSYVRYPHVDPPTWMEPAGVKVRYKAFDCEPTFFAKRGHSFTCVCTFLGVETPS